MKKLRSIFVLLAAIITLFSCNKDNIEPNSDTGIMLKKRFSDGKLQSEIIYDEKNKPQRLNIYNSGEIVSFSTYEFNGDNYVDRINSFNSANELTRHTIFSYLDEFKLGYQIFYVKGEQDGVHAYEYNTFNQVVKISVSDAHAKLLYYIEQIFDNSDDPVEKKYYTADGEYIGSVFYTYDDKIPAYFGYWKEMYEINPQLKHNILSVTSNLNDENGLVYISWGNSSIQEVLRTCTYKYGKNDCPISETITNSDNTVEKYSYEYY
ncbi:MAG: hypothetical protein JXR22_02200 [Prolixibacteraceae bacterium]|nr:hypothetical protein [Prolixibacteraceae bacterium]